MDTQQVKKLLSHGILNCRELLIVKIRPRIIRYLIESRLLNTACLLQLSKCAVLM